MLVNETQEANCFFIIAHPFIDRKEATDFYEGVRHFFEEMQNDKTKISWAGFSSDKIKEIIPVKLAEKVEVKITIEDNMYHVKLLLEEILAIEKAGYNLATKKRSKRIWKQVENILL